MITGKEHRKQRNAKHVKYFKPFSHVLRVNIVGGVLGVEAGVKMGLWGGFLLLSITLFIIAWGYLVGSDAITFSLFLIVSLAIIFLVLVIFNPQKRLNKNP
jgi:hypothetical protein